MKLNLVNRTWNTQDRYSTRGNSAATDEVIPLSECGITCGMQLRIVKSTKTYFEAYRWNYINLDLQTNCASNWLCWINENLRSDEFQMFQLESENELDYNEIAIF